MKKFTADFETCTWLENVTYVWAWATCNIENEEIKIGTSIESFIEWCINNKNSEVWIHNLKFDSSFIIYYLETHGYKYIRDIKEKETKSYNTIISDTGQFYRLIIYFKVGNKEVTKITFYDSLKLIPFSVESIPKYFNLNDKKLEIDYNKFRARNHKLTKEEMEYIKNDVLITAKALKVMFLENMDKMTRASCALNEYKEIIGKGRFNYLFPKLDKIVDKDLRQRI